MKTLTTGETMVFKSKEKAESYSEAAKGFFNIIVSPILNGYGIELNNTSGCFLTKEFTFEKPSKNTLGFVD